MTARDRTVLLIVAAMAVLAGFWFVILSPKRKEANDVASQVATAQQRLDQARAAAANAQAARRRYTDDYATVARLGKAVPVQDDVPSLVYQLETAADKHKIDFRSIKLESSGIGQAATTPATNVGNAIASANGTPGASNAAGGASAAATLPPGATVGAAGFPTMPFSFNFDGAFFGMQRFLNTLNGFTTADGDRITVHGRLLTVDAFSLSASRDGFPKVHASVRATAYLLPADQGLTAGATPTAPGTTPATGSASGQTASTSGAPTPTATAALAGGTR